MRAPTSSPSVSFARMTGAVCASLTILLGSVVLLGWALNSTYLIQLATGMAPMQRTAAVTFIICGLALLGIALAKPRLTKICTAAAAILALAALLENLRITHFTSGSVARMSPTTSLCFLVARRGICRVIRTSLIKDRSGILGVAGLVVAAVGAACCISVLSGTGDAFVLGQRNRVAFPTAVGFMVLGLGVATVAWGMTRARTREPAWVPIGATFFLQPSESECGRRFRPRTNPRGLVVQPDVAGRIVERGPGRSVRPPGFEGTSSSAKPCKR